MGKKLSDLIGQFATIPNSFILQSVTLSTEAKWLFVILRYHTNSKTGNAFPSYTKIREVTGFHRNTIAKSLKELESAGWLTKQRRYGATTLYALQIPSSSISDTTEAVASSATGDTVSSITNAPISSSDGVHANQTQEETRSKEPERDQEMNGNPEETVFAFWKQHLDHPRAIFDDKRRKAVSARLRDGHSVDDLILAVRGCKFSPHNMGQNERQEVYDDLELICRDTAHVERFIARAELGSNGNGVVGNGHKPSASSRRVDQIRANAEFLRSGGRPANR